MHILPGIACALGHCVTGSADNIELIRVNMYTRVSTYWAHGLQRKPENEIPNRPPYTVVMHVFDPDRVRVYLRQRRCSCGGVGGGLQSASRWTTTGLCNIVKGLANVTEMHINIVCSEQNVSFIYFLGLFNSS